MFKNVLKVLSVLALVVVGTFVFAQGFEGGESGSFGVATVVVVTPAVPASTCSAVEGQACYTTPNMCGGRSVGEYGCDGTCEASEVKPCSEIGSEYTLSDGTTGCRITEESCPSCFAEKAWENSSTYQDLTCPAGWLIEDSLTVTDPNTCAYTGNGHCLAKSSTRSCTTGEHDELDGTPVETCTTVNKPKKCAKKVWGKCIYRSCAGSYGPYECRADITEGVCVLAEPEEPSDVGDPCSIEGTCSTGEGTIMCNGECSATEPVTPTTYDDVCTSEEPNICGMTETARFGCNITCPIDIGTPISDDQCPIIEICDVNTGSSCNAQNVCSYNGDGYIGCGGNCLAIAPEDSWCNLPENILKTCTSRNNTCGQKNEILIPASEDCPVVTHPSESSCGVPTMGFRTKDGIKLVKSGTGKYLVWDPVLNATNCTITGPGVNLSLTNFTQDKTSVPWINIIPRGEVSTGEIKVSSTFKMTCRNGTGNITTETVKINLIPVIQEN